MQITREDLNRYGMTVEGSKYLELTPSVKNQLLAMDAQPALSSVPNAGILSALTTYIDPTIIEYLFAPLKAVEVAGRETKRGDWTDNTIAFVTTEYTGNIKSYGDFNNDGKSDLNFDFPQRQPYLYQTNTKWGVLQAAKAGLAKIDWASGVNKSSIWSLNQYQNQTYFFGVVGLQNYGLLNDPSLSAPIAPITPGAWSTKDALAIYNDIIGLYSQLANVQANANVEANTPMTLGMSTYAEAQLHKATAFNVNVLTLLKSNFPNMKIVVAPQFNTLAGQVIRLKADELFGQITEECSFTDKLRSFPIINWGSWFDQKKMQSTNGAIIYRPILVASMIGV